MNTQKPLTYLLGQTMQMVKLCFIAEFKKHDIELSLEQFIILHQLSQNENITQQDLSNELQKDKSIILRQINTLLEKRYVVRLPDKEDKRKKNLILTQKGYDALTFSKSIAQTLSAELLQGVSTEELKNFENVIEKIQRNTGHEPEQCKC
ncbi:MarR family winged helix-turn-helix transcriptional regulator [Mangrovibacterium diazotrophicum]|uniref:DNA-binding MarR family transcriptional regulator n=1 Tax=Mangrovibacterium diazotrophicum TaxID=1261403 RepID=A0A419WBP7_9BACT|nr:MarR family transcriptional regulator [Mangrovibacterium diazotrophicum]RKD92897.1 DNA-binding MarR family transcriptional regulator [Mangrovibacterium diazotrophicum]